MKYYYLIPCLCFFAAAKVLIQSTFAKKLTNGFIDSVFFNAIVFSTIGIGALPVIINGCDLHLILWAIAFGVLNLTFQLIYLLALSCGPTSITALIASLAAVVPIVVSAVVYKEPLTVPGIIGIVLIIIMLYMNADVKRSLESNKASKTKGKWFILVLVTFLANSLGILSQQFYSKSATTNNSFGFVAVASAVAGLISFVVYGVLYKRGNRLSFRIIPKNVSYGFFTGAVLAAFQIIYTFSISVIPGTVLFPSYSGGSAIAIALGSRIIFKEHLSRRQLVSFVIGIIAIVLINI